ncbi:MAG: PEP-CTERM sorting domain-containing protein [Acidobacteria bacterium]|nr:PEP-CTERM sorting domain-containing protein [Acidobacteriota bacterium]
MKKVLGVLVLAMFAMVASGASIVLVDNFGDSEQLTRNTAGTTNGVGVALTSTAGFTRWSSLTQANTSSPLTTALNVNAPANWWSYSSDASIGGSASATYTSGASFDASSALPYQFSLSLVANSFSTPAGALTYFIEDADGTKYTWSTSPLANVGLPMLIQAPVASFILSAAGGTAGLDWTAIKNVGFGLDQSGNLSADTSFQNFRFAEVPEPGTYALMGAGLAALAFLRRRK